MTTPKPKPEVPADLRELLSSLRRRIRLYVFLEGLALLIVWLAVTYWIGLAVDYLPVTFGASEMPRGARIVCLVAIYGVSAYIFYRWILVRLLTRMSDTSMAILIERRYPEFHESLLTAIESPVEEELTDVAFREGMIRRSVSQAVESSRQVKLNEIFNPWPLTRNIVLAILLLISIGVFAFTSFDSFQIWGRRLYLLSDEAWPRLARIEVVGVEVTRPAGAADGVTAAEVVETIPFKDGVATVARGTSPKLLVRAKADAQVVPTYCTIVYETEDGARGSVAMQRVGTARSDYQRYIFQRKPLKSILSSISFDVIGYDHRVRDLRIEAVDSPTILTMQVDAAPPAYTNLLPRVEELTASSELPVGSQYKLVAKTNKPIVRVEIANLREQSNRQMTLAEPASQFELEFPPLADDLSLELTLIDSDGIYSENPFRVQIAANVDQAPNVNLQLAGIGTAITPEARIPLNGTVTDDYETKDVWLDVQPGDGDVTPFAIKPSNKGELSYVLDLKETEGAPKLEAGAQLSLLLKATDLHDLTGGPNIGASTRYPLDVVTPSKLLSLLEARELGLRRRFEQILQETQQLREEFVRVQLDAKRIATGPSSFSSSDLEGDENNDPVAKLKQAVELQLLRVQRTPQASRKAEDELRGVAYGFEEIRQEIINNRVDTEKRKERLENDVIAPINQIADVQQPELREVIKRLEASLNNPTQSVDEAGAAIAKTDEIILAMQQVLDKMLDLETFNELVDQIREIIQLQEELQKDTETEQKKLFRDLFNLESSDSDNPLKLE
ncbi:hypothetical protein LOC68_27985 [Blastopirellula sp. JC732]|uniref:Polyketide synthase n=1 Tax=Blastopirellula sediminis TaxID=2894196 RepID=A0A9X1MTL9_9BACT|nr:hypothetical protein [Blastopirellula sediminis]MCC9604449.1 hypothetical protein [Blastopirellula sediminis]MCC9632252.1 hypothetical protein [Blastopirellula sediminis]